VLSRFFQISAVPIGWPQIETSHVPDRSPKKTTLPTWRVTVFFGRGEARRPPTNNTCWSERLMISDQLTVQNDRLLKLEAVAAKLGISPRAVQRMAANGTIPRPIKLGRSVRWQERQLDAFIASLQ
jgi:predicted DNA-binding transcriptional regulator AlpA